MMISVLMLLLVFDDVSALDCLLLMMMRDRFIGIRSYDVVSASHRGLVDCVYGIDVNGYELAFD